MSSYGWLVVVRCVKFITTLKGLMPCSRPELSLFAEKHWTKVEKKLTKTQYQTINPIPFSWSLSSWVEHLSFNMRQAKSWNNSIVGMFIPECHLKNTPNDLKTHKCTLEPTCLCTHLCFYILLCTVNDPGPYMPLPSHSHTLSCYLSQHTPWVWLCLHGNLFLPHLTAEESSPRFSSSCGFWVYA